MDLNDMIVCVSYFFKCNHSKCVYRFCGFWSLSFSRDFSLREPWMYGLLAEPCLHLNWKEKVNSESGNERVSGSHNWILIDVLRLAKCNFWIDCWAGQWIRAFAFAFTFRFGKNLTDWRFMPFLVASFHDTTNNNQPKLCDQHAQEQKCPTHTHEAKRSKWRKSNRRREEKKTWCATTTENRITTLHNEEITTKCVRTMEIDVFFFALSL